MRRRRRFRPSRFRRFRRSFSRRRSRVLRRFFAPRQIVPPSVTVKMVFNTPFTVYTAGVVTDPCVLMSFVSNNIATSFTPVDGLPAPQPLAARSIESYAANETILVNSGSGGSAITLYKPGMQANQYEGVLSNNYMHMGNMYKSYRVISQKMRVSGVMMTPTTGTGGPPTTQDGVWTLSATDDADAIDGSNEAQHFCRPFNRMHRYQKTKTFLRDGFTSPSSLVHSFTTRQLIKDRIASTSADFIGSITKSTSPGTTFPTYGDPLKKTYHALIFHPYGTWGNQTNSPQFPASANVFAGYLTSTKIVQFFSPHDNYEFYDAL